MTTVLLNGGEMQAKAHCRSSNVTTSITMPRELRLRLDALRLARAERDGRMPPRLREIVIEALVALVAREGAR